MNYKNKAAFVAALGLLAGATSANAALSFTLSTAFNGTAPSSAAPWLTAVFQNIVSGNQVTGVELTLTSSLEQASEFIDSVVFNVNPNKSLSQISIQNTTTSNPIVTGVSKSSQNAQDLDGGGDNGKGFDVRIDWSTSNNNGGVRRFNGTDVEQFKFTFSGLTESDFDFTNAAGYHIAAHVQGIPADEGTTSGSIRDTAPVGAVVPETSTYFAAALLALPVLAQVRRMRKAA